MTIKRLQEVLDVLKNHIDNKLAEEDGLICFGGDVFTHTKLIKSYKVDSVHSYQNDVIVICIKFIVDNQIFGDVIKSKYYFINSDNTITN